MYYPCWHEEGVEHADPLREHGDLQLLVVFEMVHELLQRHLVAALRGRPMDHEAVPQRPLVLVVLGL